MAGSSKGRTENVQVENITTDASSSDMDLKAKKKLEKAARKAERRAQRAAEEETKQEDQVMEAVEAKPSKDNKKRNNQSDSTSEEEEPSQKKQKKNKKKQVEEVAEPVVEEAPAAAEEEEEESARKRRKEEKRQRKLAKKQAEEATTASSDDTETKSPAPSPSPSPSPSPTPSVDREAAEAFCAEHRIVLTGKHAPAIEPVLAFDQMTLPKNIRAALSAFQKPTPIQSLCWPTALAGHDLIGIAKTGSGKTLGFLLPALVHIGRRPKAPKGISQSTVLVLAPTRELALQSTEVGVEAGKVCGVKVACIYGGVDKNEQARTLKQGVDIIIATPGRLLGLVREGACSLDNVSYLVLDEADRMLDMGFEPDIRAIVALLSASATKPSEVHSGQGRQTLLFSATWPEEIQKLGREFVHEAVHITIGASADEAIAAAGGPVANHDVKQIVEVIEDRARDARVDALLKEYHASRKNRVIIFVLYKKEADRVEQMLVRRGWKAVSIHGDKSQADRTRAFEEFKSGRQPLLVATDVAARGLNIPDVSHVINYSFPLTIEDYVHRIGRTGRAGKKGISHTFFTRNDKGLSGELINVLNEASQDVPKDLMAFGTGVKRKKHALYGDHFRETGAAAGTAMKQATRIVFD